MLEEYIKAYETAMENGNRPLMAMIERNLQKIGMDKRSLLAIVSERRKTGESKLQSES